MSPTGNPTTSPSPGPSGSPSSSPTDSPTANLPDDGELVESVFPSHTVTTFGCSNLPNLHRVFDGKTDKLYCDRSGLLEQPAGIIISPEHRRPSIVKALRIYAHNNCKSCDCVSYTLEGRVNNDTAPWVLVDQGDFPWKFGGWNDQDKDRNVNGLEINSTYFEGDSSLTWT